MKRRNFVKNTLLGASGLGLATGLQAISTQNSVAGGPFNLMYAPHNGMFKNHAGEDFVDQIKFMADQGFRAIEDNGMMGRSVSEQERISKALVDNNMQMGVFVVDKGGNGANSLAAGKKEYEDIFLDGCRRAVEVAKRVNATWMTVVPGNFERHLPLDIQTAHVIESLRKACDIFEPHGLVMVLEPLSDTPDLYLRFSPQTYLICRAVNSPSCKILFDAYHQQKNEGNLIKHVDLTWDEIAYFQVGDNPGRKEPYTGEVNYQNFFKHLYEKGFKGVVGMEHGLSEGGKAGEQKLIQAYRKADDFL